MDQPISATEANRAFFRLMRKVREEGRSFVITLHGEPVARIHPCNAALASRKAARVALFARLSRQAVSNIGDWSRDELYER